MGVHIHRFQLQFGIVAVVNSDKSKYCLSKQFAK